MRVSTIATGCLAGICLAVSASNAFSWERQLTFDGFPLASNSYWNGSDLSGGFRDENVHFNNTYNPTYASWSSFSYSNVDDTNTAGYGNQYAVWAPGTGRGGTGNYAVCYYSTWDPPPVMTLPRPGKVEGFYVDNTTYTALALLNGGMFAKKFGGDTGDDPDWLLLTIIGRDEAGAALGTNTFYLADYRFTNNANDYIVSDWTWVGLTNMGETVKTLHFSMSSSDTGMYGMNTPAYFAVDDVAVDFAYEKAAGQSGSTAVFKDHTNLIAWATGWTNYIVGPQCDPGFQTPSNVTGKAEGTSFDIVCLGQGGQITTTFDTRIANGAGADLAVFENAFDDTFLELGYVEVSSDGVNFFRFRNHSMTTNPVPGFGAVDCTAVDGYCSKYRQGYGTPFDLDELKGVSPLLDVNNVCYVKIIDVVGDGSRTDSFGNVIYDPYPTTNSAGVDLDAVGVLNTGYAVTSSAGAHGSISPSGTVYVAQNTDRAFTITPGAHHHIADVKVDGISVGTDPTVALVNVTNDRTITAVFSNAAPVARMQTPVDGGEYGVGNTVTLMGDGLDREDGVLTNGVWVSDLDGVLGTGTLVRTDMLRAGDHTITLHAVDPMALTGSVSRAVRVLGDSDGDGIPDDWETEHYGRPTNAVAGADTDEDGMTSYEEWLAGTLPNEGTNRMEITDIATNGASGFVITWPSVSNRVYEITHGTNLASPFSLVATVPATPPVNTYTNDSPGQTHGFYRISVSQ